MLSWATTLVAAWGVAGQDAGAPAEKTPPAAKAPEPAPLKPKEPPPLPKPAEPATPAVEGLRNLRTLARRLRALNDAELAPGVGLWTTLSKAERLAGGALASGKAAAGDETLFAAAALRWLDEPKLPEAVGLEDAGARDPELSALLKLAAADLAPAALRRRNRMLLAAALPFDFAAPPLEAKRAARADSASLYPPAAPGPEAADRKPGDAPAEVLLKVTAPELRGKLLVYFDGFDAAVTLRGAGAGQELRVPNTGVLRYRLIGDTYAETYPRKLKWDTDAVKAGKATAELRVSRSK